MPLTKEDRPCWQQTWPDPVKWVKITWQCQEREPLVGNDWLIVSYWLLGFLGLMTIDLINQS